MLFECLKITRLVMFLDYSPPAKQMEKECAKLVKQRAFAIVICLQNLH